MTGVRVTDFGAAGDGVTDDRQAFQKALDSGAGTVVIPFGRYAIGGTLRVGSNTLIQAHPLARVTLMDGACTKRGDFLIDNKHHEEGDENIAIEGGIWDYNNPGNPRGPELFDQERNCGSMMNFRSVRGLRLSGMRLCDPECFYIRMCRIDGFVIEDIRFEVTRIRPNQDGVHMNGHCKNGVIRRLTASPGATNDDLIAMNADDSMTRQENADMVVGPIENIVVHDIRADDCHSFVRALSIVSPIRNIEISGVRGGCKAFALNMDAARYCRTPLFKDEDYPDGVGFVENFTMSDVEVVHTGKTKALYCVECNCQNLVIRGHRFDASRASRPLRDGVFVGNIGSARLEMRGVPGAQAQELLRAGGCAGIAVEAAAHPHREDAARVTANMSAGEWVRLPACDFDELTLNRA